MALWRARRTVYKVGVGVQHAGLLLYVVGFSTPYWFYASPGEGSQGLWQYCNGRCHKLQVEEEWFDAVRALLCLTLIVNLMACVLAVYDNCLKKYNPLSYSLSRRVEITTAAAGLMGACGLSVYTIMMELHYQEYSRHYFGPAYAVTATGCALALLAAVLLCATGSSLRQDYVTLMTPAKQQRQQHISVTYHSTSRGLPPPPQAGGFGFGGTPAPAWSPTPPVYTAAPNQHHEMPSYYMRQQQQPPLFSFGYPPSEFSDPSVPGYPPPLAPVPASVYPSASGSLQPVAPPPRLPPPYVPPTAPPAHSSSFLD
ncbi:uncharacterized protein LOC143292939 [Babylonia areolata]|uniref:uncharacterized protein LOC143292939 n=1 Tax=Babylonia areolata TaxID=304850 RepID=UPI003FD38EB8